VLPLRGVTVLSLEHAVSTPFATRQLADLGARVIKVERPGSGDFARQYALDVKSPNGREILHELADKADVIVQNLGPGAAAGSACRPMICAAAIRARSSWTSPDGAATGRGPTARPMTCWCSVRPGWCR
jgi:itaconate CoA-transferase